MAERSTIRLGAIPAPCRSGRWWDRPRSPGRREDAGEGDGIERTAQRPGHEAIGHFPHPEERSIADAIGPLASHGTESPREAQLELLDSTAGLVVLHGRVLRFAFQHLLQILRPESRVLAHSRQTDARR